MKRMTLIWSSLYLFLFPIIWFTGTHFLSMGNFWIFFFHSRAYHNGYKEISISSFHCSKCGLTFSDSPAASVLNCTELRRFLLLMCCMECVLLVTNCSGDDFSVWVVSSFPSSSKLSQLWFRCLWISAELWRWLWGAAGVEMLLEIVQFPPTSSSRESQILATIQCENPGRRAEFSLVIHRQDHN